MKKAIIISTVAAALLLSLTGCGSVRSSESESAAAEPQTAVSETYAPAAESGRQDGERFEAVITVEGMEESVIYEHAKNEQIGFAVDFECEDLERRSESGRECFVSRYDLPEAPWNYLEVRYGAGDADTVAAAESAALSNDFNTVTMEPWTLDCAGSCIRIDASDAKVNAGMLRTVYIVPADDGCRVAAAHYTIESAEGFGVRFSHMMNSFTVFPGQGVSRLTDEQAVSAIKNYCLLNNPNLAEIVNAGEYPVYWEVLSSDEQTIVVLFRSYTGSETRYYIDPVSGDAYVTEYVPGITPEEERTDESLNVWDYLNV